MEPIQPPPIGNPPLDADALACPGCGYNLRGVCIPEKPVGRCPECGNAFRRDRLIQYQQATQNVSGKWVAVELICYPIFLAMLQGCLGCAGLIEMQPEAYFFTPIDLLGTPWIVVPILGAILASGLVASHTKPPLPPTASPQRRKNYRADLFQTWGIFFALEILLTATYLFVGCGGFM